MSEGGGDPRPKTLDNRSAQATAYAWHRNPTPPTSLSRDTTLGSGSGSALAVLTAFSVGMTGSAAPAVTPLVYVTVVAAAGLLALVGTALPGRMALKARPVTVATARE